MTNTKNRGCTEKVRHDNRQTALAAMWSLVHRRGACPARYNVYRCRHCPGWHVGHRPRRRR